MVGIAMFTGHGKHSLFARNKFSLETRVNGKEKICHGNAENVKKVKASNIVRQG